MDGSVDREGSTMSAASPGSTPVPAFLHAYSPVSNEYLDGVHVAADEWASVNRNPAAARRSMFGVCTAFAPYAETSPYPRSSVMINTIFGRSCANSLIAPIRNAATSEPRRQMRLMGW